MYLSVLLFSIDVKTSSFIKISSCFNFNNFLWIFFRDTILTTLMSDVLGGNCFTNCLATFKPIKTPASPIIMRYALRLKSVVNYPTPNTIQFKVLFSNFSIYFSIVLWLFGIRWVEASMVDITTIPSWKQRVNIFQGLPQLCRSLLNKKERKFISLLRFFSQHGS